MLKLYIKHLKLTLILKDEFENDEIDSASENLLKESIETNDLKLINSCLKIRIQIVAKYLKRKEKAVSVFQENIGQLRTKNLNVHWVSCVLDFFNNWSGSLYCKNNPEEAGNDLKLCEDFIYKRHNSTDWTELIEAFYNAKKRFLKAVGNKDELKVICNSHKEIIIKTIGEKTKQYGDACFQLAACYQMDEDYENVIKYRLLQIKTFEELYKNKPKPWSLQTAYINTSLYYYKYMNDYNKGLEFGLKALEIAQNTKGIPDYSIENAYFRIIISYIALKDYKSPENLVFENLENVKNSSKVTESKIASAHNLIGINYKWSAESNRRQRIGVKILSRCI